MNGSSQWNGQEPCANLLRKHFSFFMSEFHKTRSHVWLFYHLLFLTLLSCWYFYRCKIENILMLLLDLYCHSMQNVFCFCLPCECYDTTCSPFCCYWNVCSSAHFASICILGQWAMFLLCLFLVPSINDSTNLKKIIKK